MSDPIKTLRDEARTYAQLREELDHHPDIDPQALVDTLEGATDLDEAALALIDHAQEMETQAKGIQGRIDNLKARKDRCERTADHIRAAVLQAMEIAGVKTIKGDCVTLTARPLPPKAIVENEAEIPADYWKPQDPVLDKRALTEALKNGAKVAGATLSNGGLSLNVRVK